MQQLEIQLSAVVEQVKVQRNEALDQVAFLKAALEDRTAAVAQLEARVAELEKTVPSRAARE